MPHLSAAASRLALRALAIVLPFLAALSLASVALPARAAVSPFPPIDLGTHPVGSSTSYDLVVPLTIPFASIPASYDGVVLFTAPDPATVTALAVAGFASPVTVGQVKALMPAAAITPRPIIIIRSSRSRRLIDGARELPTIEPMVPAPAARPR